MDKEGQTSEMDLSSEKSFCSSCGFYYGERQSEEEKDEVMVLQDMLERFLHGSMQTNRREKI